MIKVFLNNDGMISSSSIQEEACLGMPNDGLKKGFNPIDNDLSNNFILSITETYGFKIFKERGIPTLGNEENIGTVNTAIHRGGGKSVRAELQDEGSHDIQFF